MSGRISDGGVLEMLEPVNLVHTLPLLVVAVAVPVLVHRFTFHLGMKKLVHIGMVRENYRGERIPTAAGLLLVGNMAVSVLMVALVVNLIGNMMMSSVLFTLLPGLLCTALIGWYDDLSTDKAVKGFRGHFGIFFRDKRLTSGLVKAVGVGVVALTVGGVLTYPEMKTDTGSGATDSNIHLLLQLLTNAALIALSTNLINLFDLRPTRAIKVFWLIMVAVLFTTPLFFYPMVWGFFLPVMIATLLYFPYDARGQVMLGDTGANALGFLTGYTLVISCTLPIKLTVVALFVLLHLVAEKVSFSRVIRSTAWLNRLDEWGRARDNM
ncbi:UDP-N-acetylmuramyl pentapeptide phosphotransferase [Brevibacillus dissolubilis]|uniref:UDP-N-acetylmuramyl pentapeptide phosphotransferase n=1 Tax=Brevibacillus dissolubilis TaxID=1844116 RepID=UPI001115F3BC|nr:UDP-N-acetylmuramyl pentapeptide phosphotransferase [Brevibacillus dissolubilis]